MKKLLKLLQKPFSEYKYFMSHNRDMRILLETNMIYAFVLPVIDIFVGAYIMRSSNDPSMVAVYQLAVYSGIPVTFLINGLLLSKIKISRLYSFGMLLSGLSMIFMMSLSELDYYGVAYAGFIMGASFGFFWANRDFLALNTTNNNNRNYYYGFETFFYTITSIVVPFVVGWFLMAWRNNNWFGGVVAGAYQVVTLMVFILTILASIVVHKGNFKNPLKNRFLYIKFDKLWWKLIFLAALKGLVQGYLVTAPAILVMRLVGDEGSLGLIQSISGILTAIILYLLGRFSRPEHRIAIFTTGLLVFVLGTLANAIMFSATGVIVFMLATVLFKPLHDLAYFPIQMRVIDVLSKKENRNEFSYIFHHEFGLYIGRILGLGLFLILFFYISEIFSLKFSLLIVAIVQTLSIPVAVIITKRTRQEEIKQGIDE